jgi:hypothetical protein
VEIMLEQLERISLSPALRAWILLGMAGAIVAAGLGLNLVAESQTALRRHQTFATTVPYFSGAANYEFGEDWRIDVHAVDGILDLPFEEQRAIRWPRVEETVPFTVQAKGYLYVSLIARNLFFWQGDMQAVESFQLLTHVLLTIFVVAMLSNRRHQLLFFVGYGLNPLVLFFVTYPFYYYWQAVPSALLIPYLLNRNFAYGRWALLVGASIPFWFQIRPTTLFVSIFLIVMIARRESLKLAVGAAAAAVVFMLVFVGGSLNQNPWHTAYVGLSAYPNEVVPGPLADMVGYDLFERETGVKLDLKLGGNYFEDDVFARFREVEKEHYLKSALQMPVRVVGYAAVNFFQSYSFGYRVGNLQMSYASALLGACFLGTLLWRRRWDLALAIGLCSISFVPYYPPIQVYMYGAYGLIVAGAISLLDDLPIWERVAEKSAGTRFSIVQPRGAIPGGQAD